MVEHDDDCEIVVDCGTVNADVLERRRAAATLVMAHFMVRLGKDSYNREALGLDWM